MISSVGKTIFISLLTLASITIVSSVVSAAACVAELYNDSAFTEPTQDFSPYDKIFIVAQCTTLAAGSHTIHVNWINAKRGIVRSNNYDFTMIEMGRKSVYFWMRLMKKGPLASMFSQEDFNRELLGSWVAELYLDDDLLVSKEFTIY